MVYTTTVISTILNVVHYGLGPIGSAVASLVASRPGLHSFGAVDISPDKVGRRLGELLGGEAGGPFVSARLADIDGPPGAVVVHSTGSALSQVRPQLLECMARGFHVVSTCEELSYPWLAAPELAAELDQAAQEHGVTLLGTGVNPGFAMDYLPIVLSGASAAVTSVRVHRVQDAGRRRTPLQRKIGATLSAEVFEERVREGVVRHVGLVESAQALAGAFGWRLDQLDDEISPLLASEPTPSALGTIAPGHVTGVHQVVTGRDRHGTEVVRLALDMAVGLADPRDEIELSGDPEVRMVIPGGLHGDAATAAVTTNCVMRVVQGAPGLQVMADTAPPHPTSTIPLPALNGAAALVSAQRSR